MLYRENALEKTSHYGLDSAHTAALVAQQILLDKIAHSRLKDSLTIKGGVVMFHQSGSARRATIDVDVDVIRYSLNPDSIKEFIQALNYPADGIRIVLKGAIEPLSQEDYHGYRVHLVLSDAHRQALELKMDIGVHTLTAVRQDQDSFFIDAYDETVQLWINPNEQIFGEKLLSLVRHGIASTRYKDIADLYFFVKNSLLDKEKIRQFLSLCLPTDYAKDKAELVLKSEAILQNATFASLASSARYQWCGADYKTMANVLVDYLDNL